MDNAKFDKIIRDKVQHFEKEYNPTFDKQKVWANSKKAGNRINWALIAAVWVTVITGLFIFIQNDDRPIKYSKQSKHKISPDNSGRSTESSIISRHLANAHSSEQHRKEHILTSNSNKQNYQQKDSAIATTSIVSEVSNADTIQTVLAEPAEKIASEIAERPVQSDLTQSKDLAVAFKRGKAVVPVLTESKFTIRKFRLKIFENQLYDTSAYASRPDVEQERKLKIRF